MFIFASSLNEPVVSKEINSRQGVLCVFQNLFPDPVKDP